MVMFVIVLLWNRVLNDLRCCGDFLGIYVGKKLSICTRKDTSNLRTNDDGDYGDRDHRGWNQGG